MVGTRRVVSRALGPLQPNSMEKALPLDVVRRFPRIVSSGVETDFITMAASFHLDRAGMGFSRRVKQHWKTCYLQTENIEECDKATGFPIYSTSAEQIRKTHLQEKLEYLKKTRQNLYLD
jgi:hypothetical protein